MIKSIDTCLICFEKINEKLDCGCNVCDECFFLWSCYYNKKSKEQNYSTSCKSHFAFENNTDVVSLICPNYLKCKSNKIDIKTVYKNWMVKNKKNYITGFNQIILDFNNRKKDEVYITCQNKNCKKISLIDINQTCQEELECLYCNHKWYMRQHDSNKLKYYIQDSVDFFENKLKDFSMMLKIKPILMLLMKFGCFKCNNYDTKYNNTNYCTDHKVCYFCSENHSSSYVKHDLKTFFIFLLIICMFSIIMANLIYHSFWIFYYIYCMLYYSLLIGVSVFVSLVVSILIARFICALNIVRAQNVDFNLTFPIVRTNVILLIYIFIKILSSMSEITILKNFIDGIFYVSYYFYVLSLTLGYIIYCIKNNVKSINLDENKISKTTHESSAISLVKMYPEYLKFIILELNNLK